MWQNTQRHYSSNLHVWLELTDPLRAHFVQLYSEKPQSPGLSRGTRLLTATIVLSRHGAFPSTKQNVAPFSIWQGLCPFGIPNPSSLHLRKGQRKSQFQRGCVLSCYYMANHLSVIPKLLKFLHKVERNHYYGFPYGTTVSRMPRTLGKNVAGLQWHPFLFWRHSNLEFNLSSFCILYNLNQIPTPSLINAGYLLIDYLYRYCKPKAFPTKSETRQGCPLSPILFNIVLEDLDQRQEKQKGWTRVKASLPVADMEKP